MNKIVLFIAFISVFGCKENSALIEIPIKEMTDAEYLRLSKHRVEALSGKKKLF